jgi:DNA-binding transcriptional LysR family regulator
MASIDHFNLRAFDLNLLVAFDAMMRDRSVTKAAARLKIQQPAMSHNLSTLRMLMGDELFVRVGNVMKPTAKAEALSAHVSRILEQTQSIIQATDRFEPARAERTFRLGFSCDELLLVPELSLSLEACGRGLKILAQRVPDEQVGDYVDEGVIDLAIGCYALKPARYRSTPLLEQNLVCCYKPELLGISAELDLKGYLSTRHAMVSQQNSMQGCLGSLLSDAGYEVNAVVAVPDYLTAFSAAAAAPLVVTAPRQIAARYAGLFDLAVSPAPVNVKPPSISMIWSARSDHEPSIVWLRQRIMDAVKQDGSVATA